MPTARMESSAVSYREKSARKSNMCPRTGTSDSVLVTQMLKVFLTNVPGCMSRAMLVHISLQAPLSLGNNGAQGYSPAVEHLHPIQTAGQGIITVGDTKSEEFSSARVSSFPVLNGVIKEQLKSKKFTEYDLHCLLKKHRKDIVPLLMLDESGFNMLHQCIQHNRITFLKVFQAHGYWADLIEQEIPSGSFSEYAGCTPKQMAERKRMRRLVKEIDRLSQQEKSMSDRRAALRAARAGDLHLLKTMAGSGNADMKAKDSEGNNCVHWAAVSGNLDVVIYLTQELKLRADLLNENGQTPLHVAVMYGQNTLIPFLTKEFQLDPRNLTVQGKHLYSAQRKMVTSPLCQNC